MSAVVATIAVAGAALGAANAGLTIYERWLRRPRLRIDQRYSWLMADGPDKLAYQINMRLSALHKDIYIHDAYLINRRPPGAPPAGDEEITRLEVARLHPMFDEALGYDLEPQELVARLAEAQSATSTRDLKIAAGGIMTVTAAAVVARPGAAADTRKGGWWLVLDYGVGRTEEKVFNDL